MKHATPSLDFRLPLAIGGLSLAVACDDPPLAERLREAAESYAPWLWPGPARCQVTVQFFHDDQAAAGRPGAWATPQASFARDGTCWLRAPGVTGCIAADVRSARLQLAGLEAASPAVDYFLRAVLALLADRAGGFLLHSAGLLRRGRAVVLSGQSGAGKSTAVRVSAGLPDTAALGDDLILLLPDGDGWRAYGTPFWNPETPAAWRGAQTESGQLAAILPLAQDRAVFAQPLAAAAAVAGLLSALPIAPLDANRVPALLARLARLAASAPVAELHLRPDPSFWSVIDALIT